MKKLYSLNVLALMVILFVAQRAMAAEAPFLPPVPTQTATVGDLFTLDLNALYANPPETYELLESRPGMTINATTGLIQWTPLQNSDGGLVTVRAYNTAGESVRSFLIYLTDAIVCANELISYWKLDETSGSTYSDFQGGYIANSLTPLVDTEGRVDRAKVFAPLGQTDQYLYVTDENQYEFARSGGFSVSMWFKYAGQHLTYDNNQVLIARGSAADIDDRMFYLLMVDVNGGSPRVTWQLRPKRALDPIKTVTPNVTLSQNTWYHVVAVYQGAPAGQSSTLRLYINNQKFSYPHIFGEADFEGEYDLNIGYWSEFESNTYPFNGTMDEILVYRKALSDADVGEIYNDGLTGKPHCRPGNYYPLITTTPVKSVLQNETYNYTFGADDYDGDDITLSAVTIPDWLTFTPATGLLTGIPGNDDVGDHSVSLKATDGTTDIFQNFTITVVNVNDPPEFISIPDTTAVEGEAYTYFVEAEDPDDDALVYEALVLPGWLTFNPATRLLVGIPKRGDAGDNPVSISVTDGEFQAVHAFTIKVQSNNNVPIFTSTPVTQVDNYSQYTYTVSAFDADPGDVLTFSVETVPAWANFDVPTRTLSGTPEKVHVGDHPVVLVVSDGYDEARQQFTINVRDVNTAPRILSVPNDTAEVGKLYIYLVEVVDNEGDQLTFTPTLVPGWLTFNTSTRVLNGTPTADNLGQHNVIITVSDGAFTVNHQFVITVVSTTGINNHRSDNLVTVFPNPATEQVFFEFNAAVSAVEIADISGRVMVHQTVEQGAGRLQMDVSGFNRGLYIYRVVENGVSQTGKLIIK